MSFFTLADFRIRSLSLILTFTIMCLGAGFFLFVFVFVFFAISWAAPVAYGGSQARGPIGAVATRPTPQP